MYQRLLGTGASGDTSGGGRTPRRESALLDGNSILLDATRDFKREARGLDRIDAILLTHAHRDAFTELERRHIHGKIVLVP